MNPLVFDSMRYVRRMSGCLIQYDLAEFLPNGKVALVSEHPSEHPTVWEPPDRVFGSSLGV